MSTVQYLYIFRGGMSVQSCKILSLMSVNSLAYVAVIDALVHKFLHKLLHPYHGGVHDTLLTRMFHNNDLEVMG